MHHQRDVYRMSRVERELPPELRPHRPPPVGVPLQLPLDEQIPPPVSYERPSPPAAPDVDPFLRRS